MAIECKHFSRKEKNRDIAQKNKNCSVSPSVLNLEKQSQDIFLKIINDINRK